MRNYHVELFVMNYVVGYAQDLCTLVELNYE